MAKYKCGSCGYEGECYGTPTNEGVSAPCCKNCGRNGCLTEIKNSAPVDGYAEADKNVCNDNSADLLAEIVDTFGEDCPNCDNDGYTAEHDPFDPHEGGVCVNCPIQVQCEFCYTNEKSKFNLRLKLESLLSQQTV